MKQTAIEWLIEQCPRIETIVASSVLEQAKEMEKQQIEISDEEIEKAVKNPMHDAYSFREGAKWYRQQIKNKRNI
jgi:hypothetical protein